ncbi:MAG: thermonuclease family protein [Alphaproteobacteria bacterium]|nr:thermonuclease family protein [Alphaproteobacteria bacterium]
MVNNRYWDTMRRKKELAKFTACSVFGLSLFMAAAAFAQEAPPPQKMPRVPVNQKALSDGKAAIPANREVSGTARILDGEKLDIDQYELRLFGIVPPLLSATFGPQARSHLDTLTAGQSLTCKIRDRDRDGRLLAVCTNEAGQDIGEELLKQGLAVATRGDIEKTDIGVRYSAAEQAARTRQLGLWSLSAAIKPETKRSILPIPSLSLLTEPEEKKEATTETDKKLVNELISNQKQAQIEEYSFAQEEAGGIPGFVERYQILISAFVFLFSALLLVMGRRIENAKERAAYIKATAGALRGELMSAKALCIAKMRAITTEEEDRTINWPRIRIVLYQAYVSRIGILGADMARRVSAVYGQASDYAVLYSQTPSMTIELPKKRALDSLIKRIDDVLPKLLWLEKTGIVSDGAVKTVAERNVQSGAGHEHHVQGAVKNHAVREAARAHHERHEHSHVVREAITAKTESAEHNHHAVPEYSNNTAERGYTPYKEEPPTAGHTEHTETTGNLFKDNPRAVSQPHVIEVSRIPEPVREPEVIPQPATMPQSKLEKVYGRTLEEMKRSYQQLPAEYGAAPSLGVINTAKEGIGNLVSSVKNMFVSNRDYDTQQFVPFDPNATDYTAMIEADMEKYQYAESDEHITTRLDRKDKGY